MQDDSASERQKTSHNSHDKSYKQQLSNKQTVLSLLKSFIIEVWVHDIEETSLVRVEKSFILQDFSEKEADVVYQVQTETGNVIFYCLIELQSSVDFLMPYLMLLYMTEIWRDTFNNTLDKERERKEFRLPAIIPVVLYTGQYNWTAPIQFKEMIASYLQFGNHIVDFNYILLDVNRYDEQELYNIANLLSSIFVIDRKAKNQEELLVRLRQLMTGLQSLTYKQLQQFNVWLKNAIWPLVSPDIQEKITKNLKDVKPEEAPTMISNLEICLIEDRRQAVLEGVIKGKQEGRQEGRQEEKLSLARKLLLRGHSIVDIMELTDLSAEEVEKLAKSMQ